MSFFQYFRTFFAPSFYDNFKTTTATSCTTTPTICTTVTTEPIFGTPLTSSSSCGEPLNRAKTKKEHIPVYPGLERYKLLEKLGDGAFSDVYKALEQNTQEKVAIKIIRKLEMNTGQRSRVLREVQIMRSLQHDSIISLYNFMETNQFYFLILELCEGGELFHQIIHLTYFSEDLARHCIWQIAEAIRYLHEEKGVVHRDIKPENLLFTPIPFIENHGRSQLLQPQDDDDEELKVDEGGFILNYGGGGIGKVKLADFGLSKLMINDEKVKTPCGTLAYTAPEIVRDEHYSKSVDMWALGCVLYTMLCGFPPFYDDSVDVLTDQVARGHYEFLSPWWDFISDDAKDLITHVLCLDPDDRYDIHQFMQHPWMANQIPSSDGQPRSIASSLIPPPSTTTSVAKENIAATKSRDITCRDQRDRFTTSVSSMKEIINLSYKALRKSDEQKLRGIFDYTLKNIISGNNNHNEADINDGDIEEDDDDSDYEDSIDDTPRDDIILPDNDRSPSEKHHHHIYEHKRLDDDISKPSRMNSNNDTFDMDIVIGDSMVPTLLSNHQSIQTPLVNGTRKKENHHRSKKVFSFDLDLDKASLLERRRKDQSASLSPSPLVRIT
ncbi:kinase-like domain-containing protein [Absidia repens]|uniref:Kinase-like domain-containing protein n=1 Tax=Absidia repens TaxID=90262 RepID=A0A1X2IPY4_9FUNG|nr:kinase-like domain-containing protein [Absidia repens]